MRERERERKRMREESLKVSLGDKDLIHRQWHLKSFCFLSFLFPLQFSLPPLSTFLSLSLSSPALSDVIHIISSLLLLSSSRSYHKDIHRNDSTVCLYNVQFYHREGVGENCVHSPSPSVCLLNPTIWSWLVSKLTGMDLGTNASLGMGLLRQ